MMRPLQDGGRPHWEARFPEATWRAFEDFRNFLYIVWHHLGLPEPTEAQVEVAHRLQYGADSHEWDTLADESREALLTNPREDIIRAFRALGKSYTTSAFATWRLMRNPRDEKVLVISATGSKAHEFVDQTKGIMQSLTLCQWLLDGPREGGVMRRDKAIAFDVAGASNAQSHSVKAVGIDGQITGSRGTLLIADDIEIPNNSITEEARQRIIHKVETDFGPIRTTEQGVGDLIVLGTPQTEESIYNHLVKQHKMACFTIPVRYPTPDKEAGYVLEHNDSRRRIDILAPYLKAKVEQGRLAPGGLTDTRFDPDYLDKQQAKSKSVFALQYMLDTSLSDAERYPLKQHDLMVMGLHKDKAPLMVQWGHHNDKHNLIRDIPNFGFSGDHLLRPLVIDSEWRPYEGKVLFVDPAGRGKDETAWAIVGHLAGTLFLLKVGGVRADPQTAMRAIAKDAQEYGVGIVEIEPNFGQGTWIAAFQPELSRIWFDCEINQLPPGRRDLAIRRAKEAGGVGASCSVQESEWAKGQKEPRIIDSLEPVIASHRLVVDEGLLRKDVEDHRQEHDYSFLYQLTHITRDRRALKHEDRLEAVSGAVAHFMSAMEINDQEARQAALDSERQREIDDFLENYEFGFTGGGRQRGKLRGDEDDWEADEVTQVWVG